LIIGGGKFQYYLAPQDQRSMSEKKAKSRDRGWCFTLNNPEPNSLDDVRKVCRYIISGYERAPTTDTPHLQGFVYFHTVRSFDQVKKLLPDAHLEMQKGSFEEAIDYCLKECDWHEEGDKPMTKKAQGKRGREYWDGQLALAKAGKVEQCDSQLQITHDLTLYRIAQRHAPMPQSLEQIDNYWYYGEAGHGKSHAAYAALGGELVAYKKMCNKWWDGYNGQEGVIIEDFDIDHKMLGHHLKIWADKWAFPAEVKGGVINIRPKKIIVTSNWSPDEIWDKPQTLAPIRRRFKVVHFGETIFNQ